MTNHVHLVVIPERDESLAKGLGRTHLMYAQYIHRLHGRLGHLWQSRFYSCPLDAAHAHNAAAYVELNPVRAMMVKKPWDYPWSSAAVHCDKHTDRSHVLDVRAWPQLPAAEWKATLEAIAACDDIIQRVRLHTRTGRPLGGDTFLSKIETCLGRRIRANPRGRPKGSADKTPRHRRAQSASAPET
jgi:putative transposase